MRDGPYRGLEFFDVQHAGLFFGRDDLVDWLLSCLRGTQSKDGPTRFLAILGASGSGKTSLARAGLLHALSKGALPDSAAWPQAICRPGSRPLESLVHALAKVKDFSLGQGTHADLLSQAIAALRRSPDSLHLSVLGGLRALPSAQRLVLLVDQFEELFTLAAKPEDGSAATPPGPDRQQQEADRQAFIGNLLHAATVEDGPVLVILTMRADFCGKCARYPSLANAISSHQSLVGPMTDSQLREAILHPAELVRCRFDPGLADLLVREVRDEPGALPLLQFALQELWKRQDVDRFTVDAYREIGGLSGALERHANGVLQKLGGEAERELCRRILLRLVQPGEGTEDTKRRVAWREILPDAADQAPVEAIIKRLADERLIVTEGELPSQNAFVEISHEALIRSWGEFGKWIDADRAGLRTHRRLTEAADEWARSHADPGQRDRGLLYRDTRLAVAKEWTDKHPQELNQFEREFLEASWRSQEDERQRELETARRLAEEAEARRQAETARAQEAEAASRRQRKLARIAVAVAAVAIISLALAAWQSVRLADSYRRQTEVLVKATVTANDDDFATAVKNLREYQDAAIAPLRQILKAPTTPAGQKGNAALVLAAFGESLNALRPALALSEDPSGRTKFIHGYQEFRGDLREAAQALDAAKTDPAAGDFRSGLCAALGLIPWKDVPAEEQTALRRTLVGLYTDARDGGTHSAAFFALKRWEPEKALPPLPKTPQPWNDRDWAVNSLGMTMIRIPKGSFLMGDESGLAESSEKPRHRVTFTEDFFLGDREVTVRQFKEFKSKVANDPKCKAEAEIAKGWTLDEAVCRDEDCSVYSVRWFEAVAFCNWLSRNESALTSCYKLTKGDADWECVLDPRANGYRLPSEAQWEYACRAKSHLQYAFGDAERLLREYGWYETNSSRFQRAGVKLPNGWGLFNMHSNVSEWCEDVFHDNYQGAPTDGSAWLDEGTYRVIRGGSWARVACDFRCAYRYQWAPDASAIFLGFRLVLAVRVKEDIRPSS